MCRLGRRARRRRLVRRRFQALFRAHVRARRQGHRHRQYLCRRHVLRRVRYGSIFGRRWSRMAGWAGLDSCCPFFRAIST